MRLHHVGFVVRDGARALRNFAAPQYEQLTEPIADPVQRVVVQFLREVASGLVWELVSPIGAVEESPLSSRLKRGGGFDHVCHELEVGDGTIDEVVAQEVKSGAVVICKPVYAEAFGRKVAFVYRRAGAVVEFVEARSEGQVV